MIELMAGLVVLAVCSAAHVFASVRLWQQASDFISMNEALGHLIVEIEVAQTKMRAGIMAAIHDKAEADEKPTGTAH